MQVAMVGAGALGTLFGGMLSRAGHKVSFVARGESLAVLRSQGATVATPSESFSTGPLSASEDPAELGPQDLVIVTVKSWQVAEVAKTLSPLINDNTIVLPTENGVEATDQLAAALGKSVVCGLCHVIATRDGPARVKYVGLAPSMSFGELSGGASARIEKLAAQLREAGITVNLPPDILVALWSKLLFVEPFGSVGAVTRASVDVVRAIPETRALLRNAMEEVRAVAVGRGVQVPNSAVEQALKRIDSLPAGATSSMHRDLLEGRPSELSEQTGAVVRIGQLAKVPTPIHDFLWASLLPQDRKSRDAQS